MSVGEARDIMALGKYGTKLAIGGVVGGYALTSASKRGFRRVFGQKSRPGAIDTRGNSGLVSGLRPEALNAASSFSFLGAKRMGGLVGNSKARIERIKHINQLKKEVNAERGDAKKMSFLKVRGDIRRGELSSGMAQHRKVQNARSMKALEISASNMSDKKKKREIKANAKRIFKKAEVE
jgi:hypothetical protein